MWPVVGQTTSAAEAANAFGALFDTFPAKVAGSVAVTVLVVLVAAGLLSVRQRLIDRFPGDDVVAAESVLFTLVAAVAAVALVYIWNAEAEVASALESLPDADVTTGILVLVALLALSVAYTLTRVSKGLLEESDVGVSVMDATRQEAIHHVIQLVVYGLALVFIFALAGVDPGNLLVGAGALGVVLGFAARQTLGAVFAGFVILLARPFEVGDWVTIADQDGVVTDVSLFNTEIRTWDGEHVIVPNDKVSAEEIVNKTREDRLRVSVDVGVDYETDLERAASLASEAMSGLDELMESPEPSVVLKRFGDSAVVIECRFWIDSPTAGKRWAAQTAVVGAIKSAFDSEGVKIPFPQRELTGRAETGGFRLDAGAAGEDRSSVATSTDGGEGAHGDGAGEGSERAETADAADEGTTE